MLDTAGVMHHGILNVPALFILLALSLLLIKGTQESAIVNSVIVIIKVSIVLLFIALGWQYINPANHHPYMIPADAKAAILPDGSEYTYTNFFRHGWGGVLRGAAIVFFAFIGFDAVSTAAQEAKNPKKDMPVGILGSLVVCTILYVLFSWVLTGVAPYTDFVRAGKEASVAYAIETYMTNYHWLAKWVTVGILAGFSSVILVMLLGQSRVFYSMSNDGLLPKVFSVLHPKFRTPYKSNILLFYFCGVDRHPSARRYYRRSDQHRYPACLHTGLYRNYHHAEEGSRSSASVQHTACSTGAYPGCDTLSGHDCFPG